MPPENQFRPDAPDDQKPDEFQAAQTGTPEAVPEASQKQADRPESSWSFRKEDDGPGAQPVSGAGQEASWTASEFIAHDKGFGWYAALAALTGLVGTLVYLLTGDRVTVVVIAITAIIFGAFASRQPRVLNYRINSSGITIGEKHYDYALFRSFALHNEGAINSIFLIPLKRFMPGISIYFPPEQEDEIIKALSSYLPHENRPPDVVDRLMRNIRF